MLGVNAETVTNLHERLALEPRIRAVEAHRQGMVAHDAGDSELAMSKLDEALEHDPDYGLGYVIRADVRWAAQDWLPAIEDYERALELGLEPDTQAHVRERLAVSPELLRSVDLFNEGRAASEAGDYQLAVTKFTQSIELDPGDPVGYLWRGDSLWSLEAWTEATEDYERAIQLGVEPEQEAAARKRIAEKR